MYPVYSIKSSAFAIVAIFGLAIAPNLNIMDMAVNKDTIPKDAVLYSSPEYRGTGVVAVPVYLLVNLTTVEQEAFQAALVSEEQLDYVLPLLLPWTKEHEGTPNDMFEIWRKAAENDGPAEFAFFIDREGVANTTILVAQPDDYTMLYSADASQWVRENLTSYLKPHKPEVDRQDVVSLDDGAYEGYLETMADEILGKRGLTYGRVPASAFRGIWANLDLANMGMSECVEYEGRDLAGGGTVEMVLDENWDSHVVIGKLWQMMQEDKAGEGSGNEET